MIVFDNVSLHYHYDEYTLLKNLTFSLNEGVNTVLCDVQSGKSSVCKLLTKEVEPSGGTITFDGIDISRITNEGLGILYLSSAPAFFENRSVLYNIAYPLKVRKINKHARNGIAAKVADNLGITDLSVKVKKLDASERKRIAVARGLTVERKAVLFDDFFDGTENIEEILNMFSAKIKVIFTSDIRFAQGHCVVLDGGNTEYTGNAEGAKKSVSSLEWLYNKLTNGQNDD